jgi:hypothetical protein
MATFTHAPLTPVVSGLAHHTHSLVLSITQIIDMFSTLLPAGIVDAILRLAFCDTDSRVHYRFVDAPPITPMRQFKIRPFRTRTIPGTTNKCNRPSITSHDALV